MLFGKVSVGASGTVAHGPRGEACPSGSVRVSPVAVEIVSEIVR